MSRIIYCSILFINFLIFAEETNIASVAPPVPFLISTQDYLAQSRTVNSTYVQAFTVEVYDAFSNPVPSVDVKFTGPASGASIQGTEVTATTDSSGVASVFLTANSVSGNFTLVVSCQDATTVEYSLTNLADVPTQIVKVSGDNQTTASQTAFAQPLVVGIRDQYGNPVSGVNVYLEDLNPTIQLVGFGAGYPGAVTTGSDGNVSVAAFSLGREGVTTVSASVDIPSNNTIAFNLTVIPGPPVRLYYELEEQTQTGVVGMQAPVTPRIAVTDSYGNGIVDIPVLFELLEGGGTLVGSDTVTSIASHGALAGVWTLGTTAGLNILKASSPSLPPGAEIFFQAYGKPDADSPITTTIKAAQSVLASGQRTTISVQVKDQYGNNVIDQSIVSLSASTGTLSDPVRISYEGLYQAIFTAVESGDVTITGTLNGVPIESTAVITVSDSTPPMIISPVQIASSTVEANQSVQFSITSQDTTPLTYTWDFGDGTSAVTDSGTVTHIYATAGAYTVTVTVKDLNGQSSTSSMSVVSTPALPGSLCNGFQPQQISAASLSVRLKFPSTLNKDSLSFNALVEIDGGFNAETQKLQWNIGGLQGNADLSKGAQKVTGVKASIRANKAASNGTRTAKLSLALKSQKFASLIVDGINDLKAPKNSSGTVIACIVLQNYRAYMVELRGDYKAKEKSGSFNSVLKR